MRLTDIQVDPRPVALARIALGVAVLLNAVESAVVLRHVADGRLRFPVVEWMPAPTQTAVSVYLSLAVLSALALTLGYRAGVAALACTVLHVWVFMWDQQTYSNHRVLVAMLVVYLVFARSDVVWAVVRRRPAQDTVPWWPQLLMMTQLSVCYLFAALSKLNPTYLDGAPFAVWLRWPPPEAVLPVLAVGSILTELFLAAGLWFPSTRRLAVVAGVCLHLSIVVGMTEDTQALFAFALACVPLYGLYLTRPSLRSISGSVVPVTAAPDPAIGQPAQN